MLLEALRRAETAVKEALALASAGGVCCGELRDALVVTKTVAGVVAAAQTQLAAAVAKAERHGDGGTGVLVEMTGLTRREARGQVKTAETIAGVPSVRDAVARGVVSLANAKRLADAVERTSAGAVGAAEGLLKMAEMMRADDFTKQTRRWIAEQQDDGGEADYERIRARRCVRVWDSDNGMVELHGTFDAFTGRRIGNRLRAEANRLYQNDKKHAAQHGTHTRESGHSRGRSQSRQPGSSKRRDGGRTFDQCMADALDNLTSNTVTTSITGTVGAADAGTAATINNGQTACADTGQVADQDTETIIGNRVAGETDTGSAADTDGETTISNEQACCTGTGQVADQDTETIIGNRVAGETDTGSAADTDGETTISNEQACCTGTGSAAHTHTEATMGNGQRSCGGAGGGGDPGSIVGDPDRNAGTGVGRAFADICVIVQVDSVTGELVAQLPDGERLPASVLDKLTCNARISVILSNARGRPIWRAVAARIANETQRQLLLAHWGGCFHCAAHWKMCQIHHIVPVARGGETKLDNLIPVCWDCHDLIHHNHWQIHKRPDGYHTLHPPVRRHHGPAHAPEQPLLFT